MQRALFNSNMVFWFVNKKFSDSICSCTGRTIFGKNCCTQKIPHCIGTEQAVCLTKGNGLLQLLLAVFIDQRLNQSELIPCVSRLVGSDACKSKEIFAYLVHKHGSSCTTRELFAVIFEDEPYEKKLQNLLQTYIYALIKSLKDVGAEDAVVRSYNALAVNPEVLDCDYYRFQELAMLMKQNT